MMLDTEFGLRIICMFFKVRFEVPRDFSPNFVVYSRFEAQIRVARSLELLSRTTTDESCL